MADDKVPYHERYKAAPPPDYMRYLTAPFTGYWDRQGKLAREGLAMAEEGAQRARGGDMSGYLGQFLGPIAYLSSPINALLPTEQEAYAAFDGDAAPFAAGVLGAASFGLPGPKVRGLGKGLGGLADDVTDAERAALSNRLQAEAGQTGGQASNATRDQALANLTEAPQGITAYHGSPHTFDKFSMDKIGTGEGAQAYGHGLYFAENEAVAKQYREGLSQGQKIITHGGTKVNPAVLSDDVKESALSLAHRHGGAKFAIDSLENQRRATAQRLARVQESGNKDAEDMLADSLRFYDEQIDFLKRDGDAIAVQDNPGALYQVRLNVKPDELLDWDRPLKLQSKGVQQALAALGVKGEPRGNSLLNEQSGREILDKFGSRSTTNPEVSAKLKAAGIKGIRYKDAGSRGAEGGTYNYVIFDDNLVSILKRYAIPFTVGAGGAAIVSGANMPPELAAQMGPEA